ncbi:MAG TPA: hypothetical protein VM888_13300, partial [Chitinophagaceae bacterium]|nr:hypothetical protein [Chitinophagaceae bacterium]
MKINYLLFFSSLIGFSIAGCKPARTIATPVMEIKKEIKTETKVEEKETARTDTFLLNLLETYPYLFGSVLHNKANRIQVIYTQINRDLNNTPSFKTFYFNVDSGLYFYPASTVKLPVAALALQRINELNIPGLNRNTTMITDAGFVEQTAVYNDPTTPDGRPTIAHYIKKILLVSD